MDIVAFLRILIRLFFLSSILVLTENCICPQKIRYITIFNLCKNILKKYGNNMLIFNGIIMKCKIRSLKKLKVRLLAYSEWLSKLLLEYRSMDNVKLMLGVRDSYQLHWLFLVETNFLVYVWFKERVWCIWTIVQ